MSAYPCQYTSHSHSYGKADVFAPAKVIVRIRCAHCDLFRIHEWCDACYRGVQNSGRAWHCDNCDQRMSPQEKLEYVQRIGDV